MKLKIYKRNNNFYSVVDAQGREVAVFSMYKQAMKFVKQYKGAK